MSFIIFLCVISQTENKTFLRNTLSHSRNLTSGGPQGSIFAVYMLSLSKNDMPEIIANPSSLYVDDTKVIGN